MIGYDALLGQLTIDGVRRLVVQEYPEDAFRRRLELQQAIAWLVVGEHALAVARAAAAASGQLTAVILNTPFADTETLPATPTTDCDGPVVALVLALSEPRRPPLPVMLRGLATRARLLGSLVTGVVTTEALRAETHGALMPAVTIPTARAPDWAFVSALDTLLSAERPLIVAPDLPHAPTRTALLQFARALAAPVVGIGDWRERARPFAPLASADIERLVGEADLVVAIRGVIGADGGRRAPSTRVLVIADAADQLPSAVAVVGGLIGDLPHTLQALTQRVVAETTTPERRRIAARRAWSQWPPPTGPLADLLPGLTDRGVVVVDAPVEPVVAGLGYRLSETHLRAPDSVGGWGAARLAGLAWGAPNQRAIGWIDPSRLARDVITVPMALACGAVIVVPGAADTVRAALDDPSVSVAVARAPQDVFRLIESTAPGVGAVVAYVGGDGS